MPSGGRGPGSLFGMRAVVPDELIEERRRLGLDRRDEMWDGVLQIVPPVSSAHNEMGADLGGILGRAAKSRGLRRFNEPGVFDPVGVEELLFVDQTTRAFEVRSDGDGWSLGSPAEDGWTELASLGAALRWSDGRLQVRTDLGVEEV